MSQLYACEDQLCQHDLNLYYLDEIIEHLRKKHLSFIRRPRALGSRDSHGHLWYCYRCETEIKDHRSFQSNKDMWKHLNSCHYHELDKVKLEQWTQVINVKMVHLSQGNTTSQEAIKRIITTTSVVDIPPEIILIMKELTDCGDNCSPVCLGLTCRTFY